MQYNPGVYGPILGKPSRIRSAKYSWSALQADGFKLLRLGRFKSEFQEVHECRRGGWSVEDCLPLLSELSKYQKNAVSKKGPVLVDFITF